MHPEDKPEFVRILTGIADMKRVAMTKEAFEMWWVAMRDWSIAEFREAAGYLLTSCEFMPQPYDFTQLRRSQEPTADEGWQLALKHAESGQWRKGPSGDERVDAAVQLLGGYHTIAMTDTVKLNWVEKRFREAYEDSRDTAESRAALPSKRLGELTKVAALTKGVTQ